MVYVLATGGPALSPVIKSSSMPSTLWILTRCCWSPDQTRVCLGQELFAVDAGLGRASSWWTCSMLNLGWPFWWDCSPPFPPRTDHWTAGSSLHTRGPGMQRRLWLAWLFFWLCLRVPSKSQITSNIELAREMWSTVDPLTGVSIREIDLESRVYDDVGGLRRYNQVDLFDVVGDDCWEVRARQRDRRATHLR